MIIYAHMKPITIPTQGRVYSNIFGLKLSIMKCRVLRVASHAKSNGKQKKSQQNPPKDPLGHQIRFKTIEKGAGLPCVGLKNRSIDRGTKTEANKVLRSPLTVSTRIVEPTTSKATVSKEVPVLAKP